MKTHLPHKLRAALMAALASVSLTSYAAAADLTWKEPGTTSSLDAAKWSNGSDNGLEFTAGDNAVFSGTDVGCQGGTIHAVNVDVNGNTTVTGATIYSSGTVTIGEGNTLTLDGADLHISNAIKGGTLKIEGRIPNKIYYDGEYKVMMGINFDYLSTTDSGFASLESQKIATICDGVNMEKNGAINMYIDGQAVSTIDSGQVYAKTTYNAYYQDASSGAVGNVDNICNSTPETNAVVTKDGSNTGKESKIELSANKSIALIVMGDTVAQESGKLTDLFVGAGKTFKLDEGKGVTLPYLEIKSTEGQGTITGNATAPIHDYNSSEVTMKNLRVEMRDKLIFKDDEVTLKSKLENVDIVNAEHGKLNVTQGQGARSVTCSGYNHGAGAEVNLLNIKDGADLALKELNISNEGKVGVYKNSTAGAGTNGDNVGNLTMAEGSRIVVGTYGGTLEANLTMESGSILDFTHGGTLTMNGNDVIAAQDTKFRLNSTAYADLYYGMGMGMGMGMDSNSIILFTDVSNIFSKEVEVTFFNADGSVFGVESLYFQTENGNAVLSTVKADLPVTPDPTPAAPEPTTGTLSLLALAGLAARRRRKH